MSFFLRCLVLLTCATALFAQSQANTGTIEGAINDPSGKTIPGAEVTIVNVDTNFTRVLTTDTEGRFRGVLLPLGAYKVTVKAKNFGTLMAGQPETAAGREVPKTLWSPRM